MTRREQLIRWIVELAEQIPSVALLERICAYMEHLLLDAPKGGPKPSPGRQKGKAKPSQAAKSPEAESMQGGKR